MTTPAPALTAKGDCSECKVLAVVAAEGQMKVCPRCFALLWHRDWSKEEAARSAARSADIAAHRLRLKEEKQRQLEQRKAADAAFSATQEPKS
jgi:hypothetical protein